jgi:hypothetical protein
LNRVCTDQGDIVGRVYIHDSKKGVMRSQFHLTRALAQVGYDSFDYFVPFFTFAMITGVNV